MATEQVMWHYIQTRMRAHWTASRIENRVEDGMADVIYCCPVRQPNGNQIGEVPGWLELKAVRRTGGLIPWESVAQPLFLNRWARAGMHAGVLVRVGSDAWYYWRARGERWWFTWMQTADVWDAPTAMMSGFNPGELVRWLST